MVSVAVVGGTYDEQGGRASKLVKQLGAGMSGAGLDVVLHCDGGTVERLVELAQELPNTVQALVWMPNLDNSHPKLIPGLKKQNPRLILVNSKRVVEKDYTDHEVIRRMLKVRAAVGLRIDRVAGLYQVRILDPLGNQWGEATQSFKHAGYRLAKSIQNVADAIRVPSIHSGDAQPEPEAAFVEVCRELGDKFAECVESVYPERFMGNMSYRPEGASGFVVSKRNIDKRKLAYGQFVEVNLSDEKVYFKGELKPSLDTGIQALIYREFPQIKYMVHGHAYVPGAPMTANYRVCGDLREGEEIVRCLKGIDGFEGRAAVNMRGHGCLIVSDTVEGLKGYRFVAREFPEVHPSIGEAAMQVVQSLLESR